MRNRRKGSDMNKNKILITCLLANAVTACSSPPKLSEPSGDWISFEPSHQQSVPSPISQNARPYESSIQSASKANPLATARSAKTLPAIVKSDGKNVPLYKAVSSIVPDSLRVRLSQDVAQGFRSTVSWQGGDQWPFVLQKMLDDNGLDSIVDEPHGEVLIKFAPKPTAAVLPLVVKSKAPVAANPTQSMELKTPIIPKVTDAIKPVVPVATKTPATASGLNAKKATPAAVSDPVTVSTSVLKVNPVADVKPVLKTWSMNKGTTLKSGYLEWIAKETCSTQNRKWTVEWDTDTDYPIDYPLSFQVANFEDATNQLFNLYRKASAPLYVRGYRDQCLIKVSDRD